MGEELVNPDESTYQYIATVKAIAGSEKEVDAAFAVLRCENMTDFPPRMKNEPIYYSGEIVSGEEVDHVCFSTAMSKGVKRADVKGCCSTFILFEGSVEDGEVNCWKISKATLAEESVSYSHYAVDTARNITGVFTSIDEYEVYGQFECTLTLEVDGREHTVEVKDRFQGTAEMDSSGVKGKVEGNGGTEVPSSDGTTKYLRVWVTGTFSGQTSGVDVHQYKNLIYFKNTGSDKGDSGSLLREYVKAKESTRCVGLVFGGSITSTGTAGYAIPLKKVLDALDVDLHNK